MVFQPRTNLLVSNRGVQHHSCVSGSLILEDWKLSGRDSERKGFNKKVGEVLVAISGGSTKASYQLAWNTWFD